MDESHKNEIVRQISIYIENIEQDEREDQQDYFGPNFFSQLEDDYKKDKKVELGKIAGLLAKILNLSLDPKSKNAPFKPAMVLYNKRTFSPDDLTLENIKTINSLLPSVNTSLFKSRLSEVVLLLETPRRYDLVDNILEGYLAYGIKDNTWFINVRPFYERAIVLAKQFRKKDFTKRVETEINNYLYSHSPGNIGISLSLFSFIKEFNICSDSKDRIADLVFGHGVFEKDIENFPFAEKLFFLASYFYSSLRMEPEYRKAIFESAECFFLSGELHASKEDLGHLLARQSYENALERYRLIPKKFREDMGANRRIENALKLIREHGVLSLDDMHTFELPAIDISDIVESSIEHVKGKSDLHIAILYFIGFKIIEKKELSEQSEDRKFRISDLFGSTYLSGDGRVIGRSRPKVNDNINTDEEIIKSFDFSLKLSVAGQIFPSINQLNQEYNIPINYFEDICYYSPLVSGDRIELTSRGLYLGFEFRFSEAIHILSPQIEHLVRGMLKRANVITSTNEGGVENEIGMKSLLEKPESLEIFGEDLHFNLRALFTDPLGANIRNYVAHGLLSDNAARSDAVVYAWWLYLKIVVMSLTPIPIFNIPQTNEQGKL